MKTTCHTFDRSIGQVGQSRRIGTVKEERRDSNYISGGETKKTIKLKVAEQSSIKPIRLQMALVLSTRWGSLYFEHDEQLARREYLLFEKGLIEVLPNCPFFHLIGISIRTEIHMPKHMGDGQLNITLSTIVDAEVPCQKSLVKIQPIYSPINPVSIY